MKERRRLANKLLCSYTISEADRKKLIRCLRMVDSLTTDLRLAMSDVEGRIRDNNFLLVTSLARRAEIARIRAGMHNTVTKTLATFAG